MRLSARVRYAGQSSELSVPLPEGEAASMLAELPEIFATEHARSYGFRAPPGEPIELMGLSLIARGIPGTPRLPERIAPKHTEVPASRRAWFPGLEWVETPVTDRAALAAGGRAGPLIVQEYDATCLVPPGATAALDGFGNIVIDI